MHRVNLSPEDRQWLRIQEKAYKVIYLHQRLKLAEIALHALKVESPQIALLALKVKSPSIALLALPCVQKQVIPAKPLLRLEYSF